MNQDGEEEERGKGRKLALKNKKKGKTLNVTLKEFDKIHMMA